MRECDGNGLLMGGTPGFAPGALMNGPPLATGPLLNGLPGGLPMIQPVPAAPQGPQGPQGPLPRPFPEGEAVPTPAAPASKVKRAG